MTDDCRKRLTEFLGECFHDENIAKDRLGYSFAICEKCGANRAAVTFRTFDTEQDMMALYRRLWEKGKWEVFDDFATSEYLKTPTPGMKTDADYSAWLFCLSGEDYEQRCQIVAEFMEEKCL